MKIDNWTKITIPLGAFTSVSLVGYLITMRPLSDIFFPKQDLTILGLVFGFMFVLSFAGFIVWFLLGSHREEYEEF